MTWRLALESRTILTTHSPIAHALYDGSQLTNRPRTLRWKAPVAEVEIRAALVDRTFLGRLAGWHRIQV